MRAGAGLRALSASYRSPNAQVFGVQNAQGRWESSRATAAAEPILLVRRGRFRLRATVPLPPGAPSTARYVARGWLAPHPERPSGVFGTALAPWPSACVLGTRFSRVPSIVPWQAGTPPHASAAHAAPALAISYQ